MDNIVMTFTGMAHGGKDTCADFVKEEFEKQGKRVLRLAYGDYVKALCARNFGYDESNKEEFRTVLQMFGTDIVRAVDPTFWITVVFTTIDALKDVYDVFLISDARFYNELQPYPWKLGYPIFNVLIKRGMEPDLEGEQNEHESEMIANNPNEKDFHIIVNNTGTLEDLSYMAKDVVSTIIDIESGYTQKNTKRKISDSLMEKMINSVGEGNRNE
jgi:hypothetical protein